jgi:hypothetical protein
LLSYNLCLPITRQQYILLDKRIIIYLVVSAIYYKRRDAPYKVNIFLWANEINGGKKPDILSNTVAESAENG